ncbi:TPA: hypothetical protein JI040_16135 [Acinetobacter baumannii]|jgi:hypothetical protein|nr:hypothetical protein [Acinetobacter baumannii]
MFKLKNLKKSAKKSYEKTKESLINISSIFFCHVAKTYNITIQVIYSFIFLKRHYLYVVTLGKSSTVHAYQKNNEVATLRAGSATPEKIENGSL